MTVNKKKIKLITDGVILPREFLVEGYMFEKVVKGNFKSSGLIYVPTKLIGQRVQVILIPKGEELLL